MSLKVKQLFFDRAAVTNAMDRKTQKALSRFGSFVWRRDRSSQRKKKGSSAPGTPPHRKAGTLAKLTFFSYDPKSRSVVIGPVPFENAQRENTPARVEYGGLLTLTAKNGKARLIRYEPRPHTTPAFLAELPNAPNQWAESATGPLT